MNVRHLILVLLVTAATISEAPTFLSCLDVEQAFIASGLNWKCQLDGNPLGSGASGIVYLLKDKNNRLAACKAMTIDSNDPKDPATQELNLLKLLSGKPNIIKFYGHAIKNFGQNGNVLMLLQEYAENGDLYNYSMQQRKRFDDPRFTMKIMAGIVNGVQQMHRNNWVHADLKTDDVVLTKDDVPKLIDFDQAVGLNQPGKIKGGPEFRDPRFLFDKLTIFDKKVDVYSLGVILHELMFGVIPFESVSHREMIKAVRLGDFMIPEGTELQVANIIVRCLRRKAEYRPTLKELAEMIDDYLSSDLDQFVELLEVNNNPPLNSIVFRVLRNEDRTEQANQHRNAKAQRILSEQKLGQPQTQNDRLYIVILISAAAVMSLIFRVVTAWLDRLRHTTSDCGSECECPQKSQPNDMTVSMAIESGQNNVE